MAGYCKFDRGDSSCDQDFNNEIGGELLLLMRFSL
nr:MAG TPA: hypothetical protein [Caudoviricetes sp.]